MEIRIWDRKNIFRNDWRRILLENLREKQWTRGAKFLALSAVPIYFLVTGFLIQPAAGIGKGLIKIWHTGSNAIFMRCLVLLFGGMIAGSCVLGGKRLLTVAGWVTGYTTEL